MNDERNKVLMLAVPFPPYAASGTFRMTRFARYLPEFGWQPLVLTVDTANLDDESIDQSLLEDLPRDIVIRRTRVWRPIESSINLVKRAISYPRAARAGEDRAAPRETKDATSERPGLIPRWGRKLRAFIEHSTVPDAEIGWFFPALRAAMALVRAHRPQVILASGPPHSSHLIGLALKRLTRLPLVLDFRDPWSRPQWERPRDSAVRRAIDRRLERWCVRGADRVILNTPDLCDEFAAAYATLPLDKFVALSNGYDPDLGLRVERLRGRATVDTDRAVRLCHPGSVYGRRDLRPVIGAIERLSRAGRRVVLDQVGAVEYPERALRYAEELGVRDRVVLHGKLSHADTVRHMAAADIFILSQPGTSFQVPAKLFEMLAFRRPVLALAEPGGATALIVDQFHLGTVVSTSGEEAILQAILMLADRRADQMPDDGWQRAMSAFNGRQLTGELGALFDACVVRCPRDRRPGLAEVVR